MRWMLLGTLAIAGSAAAAMKTQTVTYSQDGKVLEGYLVYDDAVTKPQPGVLVFHEWWGINDHIREMARRIAEQGYVAFAPDIYGQGSRPTAPQEAGKLALSFKQDVKLLRARAHAGLEVLMRQKQVDPSRIAAIGFCFGGMTALELARSGAALKGTVSIHGGLATPDPSDARHIRGRVLVLAGGADPHVPPSEVGAFEKEMNSAGVDWQLVAYGGAAHAFTNPQAGTDPSKGAAYDERATRRAMEDLKTFLTAALH